MNWYDSTERGKCETVELFSTHIASIFSFLYRWEHCLKIHVLCESLNKYLAVDPPFLRKASNLLTLLTPVNRCLAQVLEVR